MEDPFGRKITYLRLSITDRCDLRCVYCMAEKPAFLPRDEVLSLEELDRLCTAFVRLGVTKIRLTGGEPLVRKEALALTQSLSRHLDSGALRELTLTTNGTRLADQAQALFRNGVRRINVSLDTLDPDRFRAITRRGDLDIVLNGLAKARDAGLKVKINMVALRDTPLAEHDAMVAWCGDQGFDLTFIEVMPMGEMDGIDRADQYRPLDELRAHLRRRWTLQDIDYRTGGPARYVHVAETGRRIGFITPLTNNFCEGCNRVRLTCTGTLYMCLGQEDAVDLRAVLRSGANDDALDQAIRDAIAHKPRAHDFAIGRGATRALGSRAMNVTGG
jgi:cyclic pyranopterin phosphate synthase